MQCPVRDELPGDPIRLGRPVPHSLDGQELDLTAIPNAKDYSLVSTANYERRFEERDYTNNVETTIA